MAPDAFLPHFTLGALKVLRGDHRGALAHLEASLAIEEAAQSWYLLGVCRLELGQNGRAVNALRRAVEEDPESHDLGSRLVVEQKHALRGSRRDRGLRETHDSRRQHRQQEHSQDSTHVDLLPAVSRSSRVE